MNVTFAQVSGWVVRYLLTIRISDILDIAIMAFVLYKIFTLVQSTKAASLVKGLLIFLAALVLSSALHLNGINYIMTRMVPAKAFMERKAFRRSSGRQTF